MNKHQPVKMAIKEEKNPVLPFDFSLPLRSYILSSHSFLPFHLKFEKLSIKLEDDGMFRDSLKDYCEVLLSRQIDGIEEKIVYVFVINRVLNKLKELAKELKAYALGSSSFNKEQEATLVHYLDVLTCILQKDLMSERIFKIMFPANLEDFSFVKKIILYSDDAEVLYKANVIVIYLMQEFKGANKFKLKFLQIFKEHARFLNQETVQTFFQEQLLNLSQDKFDCPVTMNYKGVDHCSKELFDKIDLRTSCLSSAKNLYENFKRRPFSLEKNFKGSSRMMVYLLYCKLLRWSLMKCEKKYPLLFVLSSDLAISETQGSWRKQDEEDNEEENEENEESEEDSEKDEQDDAENVDDDGDFEDEFASDNEDGQKEDLSEDSKDEQMPETVKENSAQPVAVGTKEKGAQTRKSPLLSKTKLYFNLGKWLSMGCLPKAMQRELYWLLLSTTYYSSFIQNLNYYKSNSFGDIEQILESLLTAFCSHRGKRISPGDEAYELLSRYIDPSEKPNLVRYFVLRHCNEYIIDINEVESPILLGKLPSTNQPAIRLFLTKMGKARNLIVSKLLEKDFLFDIEELYSIFVLSKSFQPDFEQKFLENLSDEAVGQIFDILFNNCDKLRPLDFEVIDSIEILQNIDCEIKKKVQEKLTNLKCIEEHILKDLVKDGTIQNKKLSNLQFYLFGMALQCFEQEEMITYLTSLTGEYFPEKIVLMQIWLHDCQRRGFEIPDSLLETYFALMENPGSYKYLNKEFVTDYFYLMGSCSLRVSVDWFQAREEFEKGMHSIVAPINSLQEFVFDFACGFISRYTQDNPSLSLIAQDFLNHFIALNCSSLKHYCHEFSKYISKEASLFPLRSVPLVNALQDIFVGANVIFGDPSWTSAGIEKVFKNFSGKGKDHKEEYYLKSLADRIHSAVKKFLEMDNETKRFLIDSDFFGSYSCQNYCSYLIKINEENKKMVLDLLQLNQVIAVCSLHLTTLKRVKKVDLNYALSAIRMKDLAEFFVYTLRMFAKGSWQKKGKPMISLINEISSQKSQTASLLAQLGLIFQQDGKTILDTALTLFNSFKDQGPLTEFSTEEEIFQYRTCCIKYLFADNQGADLYDKQFYLQETILNKREHQRLLTKVCEDLLESTPKSKTHSYVIEKYLEHTLTMYLELCKQKIKDTYNEQYIDMFEWAFSFTFELCNHFVKNQSQKVDMKIIRLDRFYLDDFNKLIKKRLEEEAKRSTQGREEKKESEEKIDPLRYLSSKMVRYFFDRLADDRKALKPEFLNYIWHRFFPKEPKIRIKVLNYILERFGILEVSEESMPNDKLLCKELQGLNFEGSGSVSLLCNTLSLFRFYKRKDFELHYQPKLLKVLSDAVCKEVSRVKASDSPNLGAINLLRSELIAFLKYLESENKQMKLPSEAFLRSALILDDLVSEWVFGKGLEALSSVLGAFKEDLKDYDLDELGTEVLVRYFQRIGTWLRAQPKVDDLGLLLMIKGLGNLIKVLLEPQTSFASLNTELSAKFLMIKNKKLVLEGEVMSKSSERSEKLSQEKTVVQECLKLTGSNLIVASDSASKGIAVSYPSTLQELEGDVKRISEKSLGKTLDALLKKIEDILFSTERAGEDLELLVLLKTVENLLFDPSLLPLVAHLSSNFTLCNRFLSNIDLAFSKTIRFISSIYLALKGHFSSCKEIAQEFVEKVLQTLTENITSEHSNERKKECVLMAVSYFIHEFLFKEERIKECREWILVVFKNFNSFQEIGKKRYSDSSLKTSVLILARIHYKCLFQKETSQKLAANVPLLFFTNGQFREEFKEKEKLMRTGSQLALEEKLVQSHSKKSISRLEKLKFAENCLRNNFDVRIRSYTGVDKAPKEKSESKNPFCDGTKYFLSPEQNPGVEEPKKEKGGKSKAEKEPKEMDSWQKKVNYSASEVSQKDSFSDLEDAVTTFPEASELQESKKQETDKKTRPDNEQDLKPLQLADAGNEQEEQKKPLEGEIPESKEPKKISDSPETLKEAVIKSAEKPMGPSDVRKKESEDSWEDDGEGDADEDAEDAEEDDEDEDEDEENDGDEEEEKEQNEDEDEADEAGEEENKGAKKVVHEDDEFDDLDDADFEEKDVEESKKEEKEKPGQGIEACAEVSNQEPHEPENEKGKSAEIGQGQAEPEKEIKETLPNPAEEIPLIENKMMIENPSIVENPQIIENPRKFDFKSHGFPDDCLTQMGIDEEFFYGLDNEEEQLGILKQPEFLKKLKERIKENEQSEHESYCSSKSRLWNDENDWDQFHSEDNFLDNDFQRTEFNKKVKSFMANRELLCFRASGDNLANTAQTAQESLKTLPKNWKKFYEEELFQELPEMYPHKQREKNKPAKNDKDPEWDYVDPFYSYKRDRSRSRSRSNESSRSDNTISSLDHNENKSFNDGDSSDPDNDNWKEGKKAVRGKKQKSRGGRGKLLLARKGKKSGKALAHSELTPKEVLNLISNLPSFSDETLVWIFKVFLHWEEGERVFSPYKLWNIILLNPIAAIKLYKLIKIIFTFYRRSFILNEDLELVVEKICGCSQENYDKVLENGIELLMKLQGESLEKKQGIEYILECQSESFESVSFPLIDQLYRKYKLHRKSLMETLLKIQDEFNQRDLFRKLLPFYAQVSLTERIKGISKFSMLSRRAELGGYELLISKEGFAKVLWRYFQTEMTLPVLKYLMKKSTKNNKNNYLFFFKTIVSNFSDIIFKKKIENLHKSIFNLKDDEFEINTGFLEGLFEYLTVDDDLQDFPLSENFITFLKVIKLLIGLGKEMEEELRKTLEDEKDYEKAKTGVLEALKYEMKAAFESLNRFISYCLAILAKLYFVYEHGRHLDIEEDYGGRINDLYTAFLPCIKAFFVIFSFVNPKYLKKNLPSDANQAPHHVHERVILQPDSINHDPSSLDLRRTPSVSLSRNPQAEEYNEPEKPKLKTSEMWSKITGAAATFDANFESMGELFGFVLQHFLKYEDGRNNKYFEPFMVDPNLTKTVDLNTRMTYLKYELQRIFKNEQEQEDISLKIDRDNIFEITYKKFSSLKPSVVALGNFEISFIKEEGNDQGGLTREFLTCLGKEIFDPQKGLFVLTSNKVTIQPSPMSSCVPDHLNIFRFIGRLLAKVVINGLFIEVNFTKPFLKQIFDARLNIQDLEDVDHDLSKNLIWLLNNDIGDGSDLHLFFSYQENHFGKLTEFPLKPNGLSILVDETNKTEYVKLVCEYKMITQIKEQIEAFKQGFFEIYPKKLIHLLNWRELGIKLSGTPTIDVEDMQKNTKYNGYYEGSAFIKWFWEIINEFDEVTKASFLFFVSGSFKVPHGGFKSFGFEVNKSYDDLENLPVAHTCFNSIDLPEYSSKEILREKLLKAILEGNQGFGMG